jgi:hypothetical protein
MAEAVSEHALTTTLRVARVMFPHERLPDIAYAKVVKAIEAEAETLEAGVAQLDDPTPFLELDEDRQVVELYDNPLVWKALGYEGPSAHLGGYLHRGFDDLAWLPDPPIELAQEA